MAYLSRFTRRAPTALAALTVALAALANTGCSAQNQGIAASLQELRREVNGLRADNLIMKDRLEALEEKDEDTPREARPSAAAQDATPSDRPALAVVRLSPETPASDDGTLATDSSPPSAADDTTASDGEPRTVIVGNERGVSQQTGADAGATGPHTPSYKRR